MDKAQTSTHAHWGCRACRKVTYEGRRTVLEKPVKEGESPVVETEVMR